MLMVACKLTGRPPERLLNPPRPRLVSLPIGPEEKERRLQEERGRLQLQEKLRRIGKCPAGYAWKKTSNGYVCEGGSHHVSDSQL